MHFQLLAPVLLLASAALAAPATPDVSSIAPATDAPLNAPLDTSVLDKRAKGWVTLYQGANHNGDFGHVPSNNACHNLKKPNTHSSFEIVNAQCRFYDNTNCKGAKALMRSGPNESVNFKFAWISHVDSKGFYSPPNWWNNKVNSVICWDY